ncbi:phosphodiester glycosidase family protein [Citreimonas salinaria]|nr:phosphodiester glycosidase family protein [Citreimonas salinaria]
MPLLIGLTLLIGFAAAAPARAVECSRQEHDGNQYAVCSVDPAAENLRLFLHDTTGTPIGHFATLDAALEAQGRDLVFAMNAGMYHADRDPVGHYVENGTEIMRVIPTPGPGNFGLLPNGILCIEKTSARVFETRDYLERRPDCRHATQSGPMLVIDGKLHPRFLPDSTSRYIRNGVGTTADGSRAVFAISDNPVTFHEFARFFRDGLGLPQALFFDGNVSRLYAPQLGRDDMGRRMGPIVAVTEAAE